MVVLMKDLRNKWRFSGGLFDFFIFPMGKWVYTQFITGGYLSLILRTVHHWFKPILTNSGFLVRYLARVDWPIIDHLPMTEHVFISSHMCFIVIYNVMGVLPQALEIVFKVQRKRSDEKIKRRKISFPTYKTFFSPFSLDPSYLETS